MKRINAFLTAALISVATLTVSCARGNNSEIAVGDKVPSFELVSSVNGTVSDKDLEGKVTLLCFFATWCPPCQLELAAIQDTLLPAFKDEEGFLLIVAGREHTDEELTEYNKTKGFTFPLYPDPERKVYSKFAEQTIPRAYLIDRKGIIVDATTGFDEEHFASMMDKISKMLE